MKFRKCRLEFGISSLDDIRILLKAWDRYLVNEGRGGVESVLAYVTIEDRVPGEEVSLNFTLTPAVLDRFLRSLENDGLKFTRNEIIPGLFTMCRVTQNRRF